MVYPGDSFMAAHTDLVRFYRDRASPLWVWYNSLNRVLYGGIAVAFHLLIQPALTFDVSGASRFF